MGQRKADVYTGAAASEELIKARAREYDVLHLATHGFLMPHECGRRMLAGSSWIHRASPLLNSGLLLSGANLHEPDVTIPGAQDGILTAEEVTLLPLDSTRLVVLSACETGRGAVYRIQGGTLGVSRAFQMAGAATIISAMWPVSDQTTADIMRYVHSATTDTYAEALREYSVRYIEAARASGRPADPFHWAPFIVTGHWSR